MTKIRMLKSTLRQLDLRTAREPAKTADRIYSNPKWLGLMARLKNQRGHKCEACGSTSGRIYGDHVVELQDNGAAFDASNVKLLCASCHTLKTNQRRAARMKAPLGGPQSLQGPARPNRVG